MQGKRFRSRTCHVARMLADKIGGEMTEFFLPRDFGEFCAGCTSCFVKSEDKCPHHEKLKPITDAIDEADVIILFAVNKLYNRPTKEILSFKGSKVAFVAGSGFIVYFLYYLLVWCSGIKSITGLTVGLLLSRIIFQQIATGFYEELNYRVLILEGYFYGTQNMKNKLMYGFISFLLFGAVHITQGWSAYTFLQTGAIGFAFAVMYLKSRNILLPMIPHFIYDVFANLTDYIEWNHSALFVTMNSIFEIVLVIMFVISLIMLLAKGSKMKYGQLIGGGKNDCRKK